MRPPIGRKLIAGRVSFLPAVIPTGSEDVPNDRTGLPRFADC
jgi:hypothetical protein